MVVLGLMTVCIWFMGVLDFSNSLQKSQVLTLSVTRALT
jgi:hypothetical protein